MKSVVARLLLATASVTTIPAVALAQVAPPSADRATAAAPTRTGDQPEVQEVLVTAQRRAENIQDVPMAVTAILGEQLNASGVQSTTELDVVTPGLTMANTAGFVRPVLRGVGTSNVVPGSENSIATYVDGVYIGSQGSQAISLMDIDRIEILRGPQGTLFGRNATGGVIQVVTRDAPERAERAAELNYGNYGTWRASGYLGDQLTDSLRGSITAAYGEQGEGYGRNLTTGHDFYRTDLDLATRGKLAWAAPDGTSVIAAADYARTKGSNGMPVALPATPRFLAPPASGSRYDTDNNVDDRRDVASYGASLHISRDLGALTATSITAWRKMKFDQTLDTDGSPFPLAISDYTTSSRQISQELQISSSYLGKLQWQAGLYYFDATEGYDPNRGISPGGVRLLIANQTTKSFAGYGQATYALTSRTKLTAGVRYTGETEELTGRADFYTLSGSFVANLIPPLQAERHFRPMTWRFALDRRFNDNALAYLSYSRGFKSGGFNTNNLLQSPYSPEKLDSLEGGLKTEFLDNRIRLNLSAFLYDYRDIQVSYFVINQTTGTLDQVIFNGARARTYGVDVDGVAKASGNLMFTFAAEGLHDRITDFPRAVISTDNPNFPGPGQFPYNQVLGSAKGKRLPYAADLTFSFGAIDWYTIPIGELELNLNTRLSSGFYAEPDNNLKQKPYATVNASVSLTSSDRHWSGTVWAKNLTDEAVATQLGIATILKFGSYQSPRTYGLTLRYSY